MLQRTTINFPSPGTHNIIQAGDESFRHELARLYPSAENDALEHLIQLKRTLVETSNDDFFTTLTEGISRLLGADITFVMKRMLVDDHDAAVEMPPIGEPGSCLMAAALHYCATDGSRSNFRETKYHAYSCPCAYMRNDKVFVIPESLDNFIVDNPNTLATPAEAYIAVPLFADGKCYAHFGAMWSVGTAPSRALSWAFIEALLHSLEDMVGARLSRGADLACKDAEGHRTPPRVIPHEAVSVAQSLRPYAGSLSHELRTPMQGVVGMLDVMYATVQDAVDSQVDPDLRRIFQSLKENIEVIQDSSRRAVEAADNVVHAYDMDMSVPDGPTLLMPEDSFEPSPSAPSSPNMERRPGILVAGSNLPIPRPAKRRRDEAFPSSWNPPHQSAKIPRLDPSSSDEAREPASTRDITNGVKEARNVQARLHPEATRADAPTAEDVRLASHASHTSSRTIAPGLRHTSLQEIIQCVISEGLKMGGRPDTAYAQETPRGETIEVRSRGSDGHLSSKIIEWSIDPNIPHTLFVDAKDLSKLISCVFLNAIKFTDSTHGRVGIHARMSSRGRYVVIKINDNGPGIPAAFLPKLFKPFSQEDRSLTRQSEGLGLGLLVAKGIARKLGGDLTCVKADTETEGHGTEFEIKIPLIAGDIISRPSSPFGSPVPRRPEIARVDSAPISIPPLPRLAPLDTQCPMPTPPMSCGSVEENGVHRCTGVFTAPRTPTSPVRESRSALAPDQSPMAVSFPRPPPPPPPITSAAERPRFRQPVCTPTVDRELASKYPLNFLIAEDNKINRKLLVHMLTKFGYKNIYEAHDGAEAVRQMSIRRPASERVDVILMDLWMPLMDGYEATERILRDSTIHPVPTVLAVTADVTDGALARAAEVGMTGFMTKPYKMADLQRLITEYCVAASSPSENERTSTPLHGHANGLTTAAT